jgi:hypothetical protein
VRELAVKFGLQRCEPGHQTIEAAFLERLL